MLKKANLRKMKKRGLSEIVAYAIMIAIAISLATAVFAWLIIVAKPPTPVDCKEGTSVYLESFSCNPLTNGFGLIIKNNGGFNISGVIVKISNDVTKEPTTALKPDATGGLLDGYYQFSHDLQPGETLSANFTNPSSIQIKRVNYQAFFIDTVSKKKMVCGGTAHIEPIIGNGC